jgi:hypothetical protein
MKFKVGDRVVLKGEECEVIRFVEGIFRKGHKYENQYRVKKINKFSRKKSTINAKVWAKESELLVDTIYTRNKKIEDVFRPEGN